MKILVSDHDAQSRLVITRFLTTCGHQVVLADDGQQAWDVLQWQEPPHVAILDSYMTGMSGSEICLKLRERKGACRPYVLLLVPAGQFDAAQILEGEPDDYLLKPVDAGELQSRIRIAERMLDLQDQCRMLQMATSATERDASTGLWSRTAIMGFLRAQFARSTRDGISLAAIVGDMDNFQSVGASFGSTAADAVMQEVAKRISGSIRPYDLLGRYGPDEFLIIAPDCTMSNAFSLADRLRTLIGDTPFDIVDREIQATISFGIATTAETGALDEDGLVRSADSALYVAKERGRNRVEMAKRLPRQRLHHPRFTSEQKGRELVQ